jgi:hypothetical protein
MGYHPRIESSELTNFCTTRSRNSELWFINNDKLEESILGYTAKYCERYEVTLYALSVEGNHLHTLSKFPKANRSHFLRDLNSPAPSLSHLARIRIERHRTNEIGELLEILYHPLKIPSET